MKHTPGPWTTKVWQLDVGETIKDLRFFYEVNDGAQGLEERHANARLIAAAPELLEACKYLTKEIDLSKLNIKKDFSLINAHAAALKAIRKAEGK